MDITVSVFLAIMELTVSRKLRNAPPILVPTMAPAQTWLGTTPAVALNPSLVLNVKQEIHVSHILVKTMGLATNKCRQTAEPLSTNVFAPLSSQEIHVSLKWVCGIHHAFSSFLNRNALIVFYFEEMTPTSNQSVATEGPTNVGVHIGSTGELETGSIAAIAVGSFSGIMRD